MTHGAVICRCTKRVGGLQYFRRRDGSRRDCNV